MARAVLRIEVDTSAVSRAMGDLRGVARSAQSAMTAEVRRETANRDRIARDEMRHRQRLEVEAVRSARSSLRQQSEAARTAARERMSAANNASREEIARQSATTRLYIANERNKTAIYLAEERRRTQAANAAARERTQVLQRAARDAAAAERTRTRAGRDIGYGLRRGLNIGGDAALNVGRVAYSEIRDARRTRAESNRELVYALGGAGIRGFDARAQQRVSAFATQTGMEYGDVVRALMVGQQRGSALELNGRTPEAALNDALAVVRQANATGTNAGQLLAARGRIGAAGITGANLDEMMRFVQFAADRGSVEVDQIIQQGLPGALRLMSSRTAGVSPEQRQRAAVNAFRESVAVQEVFAGTGMGPTRASNTFASLQSFMSTPRRQDLMRANLQNYANSLNARDPRAAAQRAAINALLTGPSAIYEDDPMRRGARRLRADIASNPLALSERIATAMGGNAQAAANIFAGGGIRNAQAFLVNMRNMMETLASINPETGRTRAASVRSIMSGGYTTQDIEQRARGVESDDLATQRRNEEARARALTDNTNAVVRLAHSLDNFATRNPIGSAALQSGGGLLGGLLGGALFPRIGTALAGTRIGAAVAGTQAAQTAAAGGAIGGVGTALAGAAGGALAMAGSARTAITGRQIGGAEASTVDRVRAGVSALTPGAAFAEMGTQVAGAIYRALTDRPPTVTMSPHDAAHANSSRQAGGR